MNKPDVGREFSDGNYKTDIVFEPGPMLDAAKKFDAEVTKQVIEFTKAATGKKAVKLEPFLKPETVKNEETGEKDPTGRYYLSFKLEPATKAGEARKPLLTRAVGTNGEVCLVTETIWGGSKIQVGIDVNPQATSAQGKLFVQARIREVFVHELVAGNGGRNQSSFGKLVADEPEDDTPVNAENAQVEGADASDF